LEVQIVPVGGGKPYPANEEASGILQLVPLLAAIYHDDVGALLIDEPEVSLHPQYQAFIMQELQAVAGDPAAQPGKKFVVIATHSPSTLLLRSLAELPNLIFSTISKRCRSKSRKMLANSRTKN
jgi:predicted ATPase